MKYTIIDNFLPEDLNSYLSNYLKNDIQFKLQSSVEENDKSFFMGLFPYCALMDFIFKKIQTRIQQQLKLIRCYSNLQYPDMNSSFHTDDGDISCIYMVCGNGDFELKGIKKISFKKNRLICFDAKTPHKGHSPNKGCRITLAFKSGII